MRFAGFSDFGCYGSPVRTPTSDRLAAELSQQVRRKADTIAEILRLHGWRNCNVDGGIIPDGVRARGTCRSADMSLGL